MKKKALILILTILAMVITGCVKLEQGVVLNSDGTGYFYGKSLVVEGTDDMSTELFDEDEAGVILQELEEEINGEKYVGEVGVKEFATLDELGEVSLIEVTEEDDIVTLTLKPDTEEVDEEIGLDELDEFTKAILLASLDIKFKVFVDGEIIETTGVVNEEENSVTWDIIADLEKEELIYMVKFRKSEESIKRDPIVDGVIKPGPDFMSVVINGKRVLFPDQRPVIQEGRTLVPARAISENLGAEVEWIPDKTVKITRDSKVITLLIDEKEVAIEENDKVETVLLDVPAQIINSRTMIPLRAVAEIFDMDVQWEPETYTAIITETPYN